MAKYPHRIFEMYDFCDEAFHVLTSKTPKMATEAAVPQSWSFTHLAASCDAGVTHVQFKTEKPFGDETARELHEDFDKLAERLDRASKVLLDFAGVASFGRLSINEVILFRKKLQIKGGRIALCSLDPTVRESFFVAR